MKCIILAAGYATRLYPLTKHTPKSLLEVKGKTILEWLVEDLATISVIDDIFLVTNSLHYNSFDAWNSQNGNNLYIVNDETSDNGQRLGALRDIQLVIKKQQIDDDSLILAGDSLLDFSLQHLIDFHQSTGSSSVMYYRNDRDDDLKNRGVICLDKYMRVTSMEEKPIQPASNLCVPPFYVYSKDDLSCIHQAIEESNSLDSPGCFLSWIVKNTTANVCAMEMPGKRYDIGNFADYEFAKANYPGISL